jgi:cysteine desulfurase
VANKKPVYLDYASATPVDTHVIDSMAPFWQDKFYNPSANSLLSRDIKQSLDDARNDVARLLGAKSPEITFCAGGTEANNLAILGVISAVSGGHIITSSIEHDSVLGPIENLKDLFTVTKVNPNLKGVISAEEVIEQVKDDTILVSIMYVNNEIGTVQPIKKIALELEIIKRQRRKDGNDTPLYLHTDAAQATNYLDVNVSQLGVDLMTLNGGKIYGPKQTGVLFVRTGVIIGPIIFGGGQERGLRSGTENVAGFVGFAAALTKTTKKRSEESRRLKLIQKIAFSELEKIPGLEINGSKKFRVPNNIHFTIANTDNERLLYGLEDMGYVCAIGSACSASDEKPSHVLAALGHDDNYAHSSLRISMGRPTKEADITGFVEALKQLL